MLGPDPRWRARRVRKFLLDSEGGAWPPAAGSERRGCMGRCLERYWAWRSADPPLMLRSKSRDLNCRKVQRFPATTNSAATLASW